MNKVMKAVAALMLMMAVICTAGCNKKPENPDDPEQTVTLTGLWYANDQWFENEHDREAMDFINSNTVIWYGTVSTNKNAFQNMEGTSLDGCEGWYYFSKTYYTYVLTDNKIIFNDRIFTVFDGYLVEDGSSSQWKPWDDGNGGNGGGNTPATVTVTTYNPSDITSTGATCCADVTANNGSNIRELGVCWGTSAYPTVENSHLSTTTWNTPFVCTISDLVPETKYHVRAYALNGTSYVYGDDKSFTTLSEGGNWGGSMPEGAINGKFTINANGDQVYFSKGNLQYKGSASTPYWKFADNQWDYLGTTTGQDSDSRYVDRDLFGWGTSGWNCGNTYYRPWDTEYDVGEIDELYGPLGKYNLTGTYANADWGVYNCINNGGNVTHVWRTLTGEEWKYVLEGRNTASRILYAKARINGVNGVILLPDDWSTEIYSLNATNDANAGFYSNEISNMQWITIQDAGGVFLPTTGYRTGTTVEYAETWGNYWSSSDGGDSYFYGSGSRAYWMGFDKGDLITFSATGRSAGMSVRLVSSAQ